MNKKFNNEEIYKSLQSRYGAIVAHDILVLISKHDNDNSFKPDCLALVQFSEITHNIRNDIISAIKEIKAEKNSLISDFHHLRNEIDLYKQLWRLFLVMYYSYIGHNSSTYQLKQAA